MAELVEIITELRALENHYSFRVVRSPEEQERFLRDYLADLKPYPIEAIEGGCAMWRRTDAKKFPGVGQLLGCVRQCMPQQRRESGAEQVWRPLADDEYAALSLRDKIRHHKILASEARTRAGPMWSDGKPVPFEAMPPRYHELREKARNHEAEATRLNEFMKRQDHSA